MLGIHQVVRHRRLMRVGVIVAQQPLTLLETGQNRYSQPIFSHFIIIPFSPAERAKSPQTLKSTRFGLLS